MLKQIEGAIETTGRGAGWRRERGEASLSDVFRSIKVSGATSARRFAAFLGPGYLVAVGYMDPGNWATSLAGGSKFGYTLLVVALISNIMAITLQALCARLAIASGRDLAQACRDAYPRWAAYPLWLAAEIAIIATDIAEVIGTAIGLNLLFGIPLEIGVVLTALDVFLILYLQRLGFRYLEALIITLLGVIAACFAIQIALANPEWGPLIRGFAPTTEIVRNPEMLYLAMGIIGATVMPHNLYLHSAIVQTRDYGESLPEKREALKFATIDSTVALMFALVINASILILAAASFHKTGNTEVVELGQASALLHPLLGSAWAPTLFGIALLCCGLNSTVTATLAGQAVMEGFHRYSPAALVAPVGDARHRHHPGGWCDDFLWRARNRQTADTDPGDAERSVALRRRASRAIHSQPRQDGRAQSANLACCLRDRDRGDPHCPQYQAAVGPGGRLAFLTRTGAKVAPAELRI